MLSYFVLDKGKINGTEFVALVIASMFVCLIINFLSEIQELSIGGNLIKLKQAKDEVNEAIETLRESRIQTFGLMLGKSLDFSGGWGTICLKDERAKNFIDLYAQIEKSNAIDILKDRIRHVVHILIENHYQQIMGLDSKLRTCLTNELSQGYPTPSKVLLLIDDQMIQNYMAYVNRSREDVEKEIDEAIKLYGDLLKIKSKIES
ncbi:hypothetical protein GCM10011446_03150 [Acinetobacter vivianii]|nr:hypothetical protein GCM10011446_03150 [Acinetobacter vivianii]